MASTCLRVDQTIQHFRLSLRIWWARPKLSTLFNSPGRSRPPARRTIQRNLGIRLLISPRFARSCLLLSIYYFTRRAEFSTREMSSVCADVSHKTLFECTRKNVTRVSASQGNTHLQVRAHFPLILYQPNYSENQEPHLSVPRASPCSYSLRLLPAR
jgi:hypothetical protein